MKNLVKSGWFIAWIAGIVMAKGFWSTFFAVVIPFWSYYLVIEHMIVKYAN